MPLSNLDCAVGGAGALVLASLYMIRARSSHTSSLPLPPGPPNWPLVGSLFSLPPSSEPNWLWFVRWGKRTGSDVIYFRVLGSDTVVLNSREAAVELLDQRSGIYSDRPRMVMAGELVGWDRMTLANYADGARGMRKFIHGAINPKAMQDWRPRQEQEALRFLRKLLHTPENLISHIRHMAGSTVLRLTYGYTPKDEEDEYIAIAERAVDSFSLLTTPGMFMVDVFPFLKYIPWAPFKRRIPEWRMYLSELTNAPMAFVHDQMNKGVAEPSFVSQWLEYPEQGYDKSLVKWAAAQLYSGGADTTTSSISSLFVAILHYPEVQKSAQEEIDRVIGQDRLPTLADRDSLPYIEAVYKELLRWQPLGPIGIPHRLGSTTDDEYKGMRIPANSMVIVNIGNLLHDPTVHKDPATFNPSRFLGPEAESNPEDVVFGFGRRRCPGIAVAQSSVWLAAALTLAVYDVTAVIDNDGNPILPSLEYTNGTIRHPQPFRCTITPRSERTRRLVEDAAL